MEKPPVLLIAEDNPDDVLLERRALARTHLNLTIHFVRDGRQAVEYLAGSGPYQDRDQYPYPDLLILDEHLPTFNGSQVINWLHEHRPYPPTEVILLNALTPDDPDDSRLRDLLPHASLGTLHIVRKSPQFRELGALVAALFHEGSSQLR
jgi:CheY-like chemotaxis protein